MSVWAQRRHGKILHPCEVCGGMVGFPYNIQEKFQDDDLQDTIETPIGIVTLSTEII